MTAVHVSLNPFFSPSKMLDFRLYSTSIGEKLIMQVIFLLSVPKSRLVIMCFTPSFYRAGGINNHEGCVGGNIIQM